MADQLEEYRKQMQQRYRGNSSGPSHPPPVSSRNQHNDEEVAKKFQEEENKRRVDQLRQDEELARKLQGDFQPAPPGAYPYGTPVYPPPQAPGYRPPEYIPAGQPVPPPSYAVPPNNYPPNNYPPNNYPPNSYPPPNYQGVSPNPPVAASPSRFNYQANRNSSQANPVSPPGCLPQVQDKCLGINTQVCVLASAALMTIGIIATLIALST